jgi:hypothetical protein
VLHHRLTEGHLTIAGKHALVSMTDGEDGRAVNRQGF